MNNSRTSRLSFKSTAYACYLGNFVQAIVINLTPILFIPLRDQYSLSYSQLGFLVLINFVTQVFVDIVMSGMADKYGFRTFAVLGQGLAILGLVLFALTPYFFANVYLGLLIATIIFSGGGGLMEMLLSPIVNSIPTDVKSAAMSVLHSFYAWGQFSVIIFTTLLLFLLGYNAWPVITMLWLIIPIINFILFTQVPLAAPISEVKRTKVKDYTKTSFFIIAFFAILLGGASEVSMAQWASAFMEKGFILNKIVGDIWGVAMFALFLGIGRMIFGKYGAKINLQKIMMIGSLLATFCYFIVALSPIAALSLIACAICGFAVSLLWPGTLVISSERFPLAGATMFAFMAAGGDIGCAVGPWFISFVTDSVLNSTQAVQLALSWNISPEQFALKIGILVGTIFPLLCFFCHFWLAKHKTLVPTSHLDLPLDSA